MVTFSCNMQLQTAKNILATEEFVVNFPSEDIVKETLLRTRSIHPFRILWFISVV
jgi:flavin reductase (DIM6/NTAB) family NADH-FMN oxidoreductase RutF